MTRNAALAWLSLCLIFAVLPVQAQVIQNMTLLGQANDFPEVGYNDIWGYADKTDLEYAIIGTRNSTLIYSLENPASPRLRANIPGTVSTWRDMKSWKQFVYVIADRGADGIVKIDMSAAPDTITHEFLSPQTLINGTPGTVSRGHNLYIDEKGFLYASGTNLHSGGVLIFDIDDATGELSFAGAGDPRYSHDNYASHDTLWSADIYAGIFSAQDVSDKTNVQTIGFHETSSNFTHNLWLSDDGKYLFTTDEVSGASIDAYDVTELDNIERLSSFRPVSSIDLPVIPHNTHYANGYLVVSWYSEGVVVIDAHRPENMVQVAQYDTYLPELHGFYGCWGAYPFLPSGRILASDIQSGLYIFEPAWQRACYLEGRIRDAQSNADLKEVKVHVESEEANRAFTDPFGRYKTGLAESGIYTVTFSRTGYRPKSVEISLAHGEVTYLDLALEPLARVTASGVLQDKQTGFPISDGEIVLESSQATFRGTTDENGQFFISDVYADTYDLSAGAWGYRQLKSTAINFDSGDPIILGLDPGYEDDFIFDLGWETSAEATVTGGFWERAVPEVTYFLEFISNPAEDLPGDSGNLCYVTGNNAASAGADDVDGGKVTLSSPMMDLLSMNNPVLEFSYWFFNGGGSSLPNDSFHVELSNGNEQVRLASYTAGPNEWLSIRVENLQDYLPLTDQMQVHFITGDDAAQGHLVEAAVDGFSVYDGLSTGTLRLTEKPDSWKVYPNPFEGELYLENNPTDSKLVNGPIYTELYNLGGQLISGSQFSGSEKRLKINTSGLNSGIYLLKITRMDGSAGYLRVVRK